MILRKNKKLKANHVIVYTRTVYIRHLHEYILYLCISSFERDASRTFYLFFVSRFSNSGYWPYCVCVYGYLSDSKWKISLNRQFDFISIRNSLLFFHFTTKIAHHFNDSDKIWIRIHGHIILYISNKQCHWRSHK